ncbi:DMT family transporter [Aneurinibacillus sp. Ricciae_BoGa-3]|uniref:DMT family transporter n=1 Tax=Aneurinibacillus sp. Ricciae_BoGa-3 TaxID=3022697 RepID=UPI0023403400|nr:DMT family transporter [Aneurinibacillus sp. Ricciae_BoGa-3]WCK53411.1 DMT family transporter [Aneurinibacillus sp. Ricciae_BoGa-3]
MNRKGFGALFLLAALWGGSYLFMRIATPVIGPFVTVELRVLLAGIALLLYALLIKYRVNILKKWKQYLILGGLNAAIPFSFICTAEIHLSASLASILNATTPLFTTLVAWGWIKEPLTMKKITGLIIGIVGVAVLVGWSPIPLDKTTLLSASCTLLAALSYGFGGIYAARTFKETKPLDIAIGQQLGASVLLVPFAITSMPHKMPPAEVIYSILGISLLCTAVAYLIYFYLINSVGAVKTLYVTFLVPVFGVIWGIVFLGESFFFNTLIGLIIIILSIAIVTNILPVRLKKKRKEQNAYQNM